MLLTYLNTTTANIPTATATATDDTFTHLRLGAFFW
jgi:hypothetical protein